MFVHFRPLLPIWQKTGFGTLDDLVFRAAAVAKTVIKAGLFERLVTPRAGGDNGAIERRNIFEIQTATWTPADGRCAAPASREHSFSVADAAIDLASYDRKRFCGVVV